MQTRNKEKLGTKGLKIKIKRKREKKIMTF